LLEIKEAVAVVLRIIIIMQIRVVEIVIKLLRQRPQGMAQIKLELLEINEKSSNILKSK